jgi:hypothetical protein
MREETRGQEMLGTETMLHDAALGKTVGQALGDSMRIQAEQPDLLGRLARLADPAPRPQWPMPLKDFKAAGYLEPGDVLVMTRLGSLFSTIARVFDKSRFAHVAMVFQTPHYGDGIDKTFLIEATMRGVDLEALSGIVSPRPGRRLNPSPPEFVVGVRRLETPWASLTLRRMAASRMLHFIDADDYNYRLLLALASQKTRKLYLNLRRVFRGKAPSVGEFLRAGHTFLPAEFICSGFVQYAYVDMVRVAVERSLIDRSMAEDALNAVLFCDGVDAQSPMEELMACTPFDLANTDKLSWRYLIHRGEVFRVNSTSEVETFFKTELPKRLKKRN